MSSLSTRKQTAVAIALMAMVLVVSAQVPQPAQPPAVGAPPNGAPPVARAPIDPRVQQRTYTFADTGEQLPYAIFVSSKVTRDKKAPLIIALHGLGGDQNTMMRANALQLAEEGGYIMVGPMGYNSSGWYGTPAAMAAGTGGAGGGVGMGGPPRGPGPGAGAAPGGPPGAAPAPRPVPTTLGVANDVSRRSEKDVMTILDTIRKEFNVDENRTYLMGHSMGGAGAIYLGVKYPTIWAAIGAEAPATQPAGINPINYSLAPAKNIPMIVVQGDMDTLVPHLTSTRPWIEQMKQLGMTYQYVEVAGGDHGSVLTTGAADIFAFFAKHSKTAH